MPFTWGALQDNICRYLRESWGALCRTPFVANYVSPAPDNFCRHLRNVEAMSPAKPRPYLALIPIFKILICSAFCQVILCFATCSIFTMLHLVNFIIWGTVVPVCDARIKYLSMTVPSSSTVLLGLAWEMTPANNNENTNKRAQVIYVSPAPLGHHLGSAAGQLLSPFT